MLILILLPAAFLLPPRAGAGEIIGGREAKPHYRPYMAFLKIQLGKKNFHCGGFLVSKNFVLTAAHCDGDNISVLLGAHNVLKKEPRRQEIPVCRQIPHPDYNKKTLENDIMLLQLAWKSQLDEYVTNISLPTRKDSLKPTANCSVAGWGRTSLERGTSTLHEVNLMVMEDGVCRDEYGHHYKPSTMLCAGNPEKRKTTFFGDSGGPLVCQGKAQGIVSYGNGKPWPPRVFTKISSFLPWIKETLEDLQHQGKCFT